MNPLAQQRSITCKNELFDVLEQVRLFLEVKNVAPRAIYAVELTLEEIVTNVLRYGYDDPAHAKVEVELELEPDHLTLHFQDEGFAFDPVSADDPSAPASIAVAPIGGLGIKMIKKSVHSLQYNRRNNQNHLNVRIDF